MKIRIGKFVVRVAKSAVTVTTVKKDAANSRANARRSNRLARGQMAEREVRRLARKVEALEQALQSAHRRPVYDGSVTAAEAAANVIEMLHREVLRADD